MLHRLFEKLYPALGGFIFLSWIYYKNPQLDSALVSTISNAFFIIFSICFGFISTSISILFTLQDRMSVKTLKTSNAFYEIITFHWKAILACFLSISSAIMVSIFPSFVIFGCQLVFIMLSFGTCAVLSVFRVIYMFVRILQLDKKG